MEQWSRRCGYGSELQSQLDLPHSRRVRLRAHRAEVRARDVRLDAPEHNGIEQIEHFDAEPELHPRRAEIAPDAEVLIGETRIAQIERERARCVAIGERRR